MEDAADSKYRKTMKECQHGYFHVVNHDYTHWVMDAIDGSANPTINSQGNRYLAPANSFAKEVTKGMETNTNMWKYWNWRSESERDLTLNGAYFNPSDAGAPTSYARASSLGAKSSSSMAPFFVWYHVSSTAAFHSHLLWKGYLKLVIDAATSTSAVAGPKAASPFGEAVLAEKMKDWEEIDEMSESL